MGYSSLFFHTNRPFEYLLFVFIRFITAVGVSLFSSQDSISSLFFKNLLTLFWYFLLSVSMVFDSTIHLSCVKVCSEL